AATTLVCLVASATLVQLVALATTLVGLVTRSALVGLIAAATLVGLVASATLVQLVPLATTLVGLVTTATLVELIASVPAQVGQVAMVYASDVSSLYRSVGGHTRTSETVRGTNRCERSMAATTASTSMSPLGDQGCLSSLVSQQGRNIIGIIDFRNFESRVPCVVLCVYIGFAFQQQYSRSVRIAVKRSYHKGSGAILRILGVDVGPFAEQELDDFHLAVSYGDG